ncbi:MAG: protease SohB [Pseudomonadales bacterium]|nr:protease SohB [Pseudomonadales bacterium]
MEFLAEYGLFLAKSLTLVVALLLVVVVIAGLGQRTRRSDRGHIEVFNVNDDIDNITRSLKQAVMNPEALKLESKDEKKRDKDQAKNQKKDARAGDSERKQRVYVIDFVGDVQASAVSQLREEVTAVLSIAELQDEVIVRLESPGGMVHSYGLAASQLSRIVNKKIQLTVAVDKVAASGGYMMACVADDIIAAPFALLGSIGVVAQIPNFHRLLKKNDVDVEILTAGKYKRTLTMFGENTAQGREKFVDELEDVHTLFKDFVTDNRPGLDAETVATGEAWYGIRALENKLVDELKTSDEYIFDKCKSSDVYQIKYNEDQTRMDKVLDRFSALIVRLSNREELRHQGPYTF